MTLQVARALIEGVDHSDKFTMWGDFQDRYDPYTVYELAETIAGMRVEYAVQYFFHGEWQDTRYRRDTKQEAELVRDLYPQYDTRVVRRLTTEWEEAE